jgi:hypothetical protein
MPLALTFFEVTDKEPPLALVLLFFLSIGSAGMLMGRRRPLLCVPFVAVLLIFGFMEFMELNDAFVGPAIREESGLAHVVLSYFAILVGIAMPLVGAVIGARGTGNGTLTWRWISGSVGIALLSLTFYLGYGYVNSAYYAYYLWPKEKAEDHYIMPLRWQDIVAQVVTGAVLAGFLVCSAYLLRSAFRAKEHSPENLE